MKISYRTHSIIRQIESGIFDFSIQDGDMSYIKSMGVADVFKMLSNSFRDIKIVTDTFSEAVASSVKKIFDSGLNNIDFEESGTLLFRHQRDFISSYCYSAKVCQGKYTDLVFFYFHGDCLIEYVNTKDGITYVADSALTNGMSIKERIDSELSFLSSVILFMKYADIETKELPAGQRVKGIECKYINETKSNIRILNSTWFTNLVKSDAFKVRGHFRLQPCGEGMKDRKLIWINDFQKEGYTAKARMLADA